MNLDRSNNDNDVVDASSSNTRTPHQTFVFGLEDLQRRGFQIVFRDDERLEATVRLAARGTTVADTWRRVWIDQQGTFRGAATLKLEPDALIN